MDIFTFVVLLWTAALALVCCTEIFGSSPIEDDSDSQFCFWVMIGALGAFPVFYWSLLFWSNWPAISVLISDNIPCFAVALFALYCGECVEEYGLLPDYIYRFGDYDVPTVAVEDHTGEDLSRELNWKHGMSMIEILSSVARYNDDHIKPAILQFIKWENDDFSCFEIEEIEPGTVVEDLHNAYWNAGYETFTASIHLASALINGDISGLETEDLEDFKQIESDYRRVVDIMPGTKDDFSLYLDYGLPGESVTYIAEPHKIECSGPSLEDEIESQFYATQTQ